MSSTFGGIGQASTALGAARYGLDIVSQNIANANTPGYSRQTAEQSAVDTVAGVPTIFAGTAGPGGVRVSSTSRSDDPVLDARMRTEDARGQLADTTASQLSQVESVFPEPSDNGLSEQLSDFWNAWAGVANDPSASSGTTAPRTVLLNDASQVTTTLNSMSTSLSDLSTSVGQTLGATIDSANAAAGQLATLNGQIAVASATGSDANALLDQRDQLLDKLSSLVGGVATIAANGSASVTVGGQSVVSGLTATALSVDPSAQVSVGGTAVTLTGGSAAANVTFLTTTVPGFQSQLDSVANSLASVVNSAQAAGYDLTGNPGQPMFTGSGAAGITVAITDPAAIAASATPGGTADGNNALAISGFGKATGSPDSTYINLVANVGSTSAFAQQQQTTQDAVTSNVAALRSSVNGVSTDEEVSSMLTYQNAFSAAARVLTTMDSMLDTLINHTGMVGQA